MLQTMRWKLERAAGTVKERAAAAWNNQEGVGTVEVVLLILGIFTPYYGVGIRCMA